MVYWGLCGKTSVQANAVFLRGLQGALEQDTKRHSPDEQVNLVTDVLSVLEPLLQRVPSEILRSMVQSRSLCAFSPFCGASVASSEVSGLTNGQSSAT